MEENERRERREKRERESYVEGDDDAGGVVGGELNLGAEEAVIVERGGDETRAWEVIEKESEGEKREAEDGNAYRCSDLG